MDILQRIDKYTNQKESTFSEITGDIMKNIDELEHLSGGIHDQQTKKSIYKNIDQMRLQNMDIMDVVNKGMSEL